uniref:Uncharacterized protein n=1 Tax=Chromera velia CCMP2878 TaxID=1169474 RepID=A0A0G4HW88_9ALVE|eukprot:Cvel_32503.t1-p1 / transcript=Cvel_32503.t1 / gene=Cvel_32503 / organism=Chromera_velia_CCMP2878 / gene_product=Probable E3 ubiquitin-protein ligase HERC4, putative / transcript_product=Probable E3 ubiquitin-protein ligase HERC4, putative / location=Cvel_scaffold5072:1214-5103(-) / protein_length=987 / sequence_SO=supercontig / SO=protein_coding / is_pseudo=false
MSGEAVGGDMEIFLSGLNGDFSRDKSLLEDRLSGLRFEKHLFDFLANPAKQSLELPMEILSPDRLERYREVAQRVGVLFKVLNVREPGNEHLKKNVLKIEKPPTEGAETDKKPTAPTPENYRILAEKERRLQSLLDIMIAEHNTAEPDEIPAVWLQDIRPLNCRGATGGAKKPPDEAEDQVAEIVWLPPDAKPDVETYQLCVKMFILAEPVPTAPPYAHMEGIRLREDGKWLLREGVEGEVEQKVKEEKFGELNFVGPGELEEKQLEFDGSLFPDEPVFFLFPNPRQQQTPNPPETSTKSSSSSQAGGRGGSGSRKGARKPSTAAAAAAAAGGGDAAKDDGLCRARFQLPEVKEALASRHLWPFPDYDPSHFAVPVAQGACRGWWVWLRARNSKGWGPWPERPRLLLSLNRITFDAVCYWGSEYKELVRREHFHDMTFRGEVRDVPAKVLGDWETDGVACVAAGKPATLVVGRRGEMWQWGGCATLTPTEAANAPDLAPTLVEPQPGEVAQTACLLDDSPVRAHIWQDRRERVPFRARQAAVGTNFQAACSYEGDVALWGKSQYGQCADVIQVTNVPIRPILTTLPNPRPSLSIPIVQIACGHASVLALSAVGEPWTWGKDRGLLHTPDHDHNHQFFPRRMTDFAPQKVVSIASGSDFDAAVTCDGKMWTWGINLMGALGQNRSQKVTPWWFTPRRVEEGTGDFGKAPIVWMSLGVRHGTCVDADGRVFSWGDNSKGQLGLGKFQETSSSSASGSGSSGSSELPKSCVLCPTRIAFPPPSEEEKETSLVCLRSYTGLYTTHFVLQRSAFEVGHRYDTEDDADDAAGTDADVAAASGATAAAAGATAEGRDANPPAPEAAAAAVGASPSPAQPSLPSSSSREAPPEKPRGADPGNRTPTTRADSPRAADSLTASQKILFYYTGSSTGGASGASTTDNATVAGKQTKGKITWRPKRIWCHPQMHSPWWEWVDMSPGFYHTVCAFRWAGM